MPSGLSGWLIRFAPMPTGSHLKTTADIGLTALWSPISGCGSATTGTRDSGTPSALISQRKELHHPHSRQDRTPNRRPNLLLGAAVIAATVVSRLGMHRTPSSDSFSVGLGR